MIYEMSGVLTGNLSEKGVSKRILVLRICIVGSLHYEELSFNYFFLFQVTLGELM